ncbi:hypothetical protein [Nocardia aurantia]|nr:hypothetical protein [Nocardia aurantia]
MPGLRNGSMMIEGRIGRDASAGTGVWTLAFRRGPDDPVAVAVPAPDQRGSRLGALFGRGRPPGPRHRLTYTDGSVVLVEPRGGDATVLRRGDGAAIGTILHGISSTAAAATGGTLCHFVPHPTEPRTPDLFHLLVLDQSGNEFGRLQVIRTVPGWAPHHIDQLWDTHLWWDRTGTPLPLPILGTRLVVERRVDREELDALLGACVDMALGMRPYITAMRGDDPDPGPAPPRTPIGCTHFHPGPG